MMFSTYKLKENTEKRNFQIKYKK